MEVQSVYIYLQGRPDRTSLRQRGWNVPLRIDSVPFLTYKVVRDLRIQIGDEGSRTRRSWLLITHQDQVSKVSLINILKVLEDLELEIEDCIHWEGGR